MTLEGLRRGVVGWFAQPAAQLLARSRLSANTLTALGLLFSLGSGGAAASGELGWGAALLLVAGVLDLLDGTLARLTGTASAWGALLDSSLDRLSDAAPFLGVLYYYQARGEAAPALLAAGALVASFLVSYVKARGEGLGLACPVGFFTRPERVIVLILGLLLQQLPAALVLILALSLATAAQRLAYLWRQIQKSG